MANIMPASGVLKAAAIPAAPPARARVRRCSAVFRVPYPSKACMMEAPTCTVGPSRPMEAPIVKPPKQHWLFCPNRILLIESRWPASSCAISVVECRAAIVCGIPLPCVPRKKTSRDPGDQCESGRHVKECCPGNVINYPLI